MNQKSKELIERYLYDVMRYIPEKQREDIRKELDALIDDMLAEHTGDGEITEEDVKAVLTQLGKPSSLAAKYKEGAQHLIGGEYYVFYCYMLKLVLPIVGITLLVLAIVSGVVHAVIDANGAIGEVAMDILDAISIPGVLLGVFGVITIVFAIMERSNVRIDEVAAGWTPDELPEVPDQSVRIKRSESIGSIIFNLVAALLFIAAPQLAGVWLKSGDAMVSVPIFNLSIWDQLLPLFLISITIGITYQMIRLIMGRYCVTVAIASVINTIFGIMISGIIFFGYPVWNPELATQLEKFFNMIFNDIHDILHYWNTPVISRAFFAVLCFAFMLDTVITVYKSCRCRKGK